MSTFLTKIAEILQDREELTIKFKKIGEDLILTAIPDKNGKGKLKYMTIPKADIVPGIDELLVEELKTSPGKEKAKFQVNETDVPAADKEEEEEEEENSADDGKGKKVAPAQKTDKKPASQKEGKTRVPRVKKDKTAGSEAPKKDKEPAIAFPDSEKADIEAAEKSLKENVDKIDKAAEELKTKSAEEEPLRETSETKEPETSSLNSELQPANNGEQDLKVTKEKKLFDYWMEDGKKQMALQQYPGAVESFNCAVDLFPEDSSALLELAKAQKWVKAMSEVE